jgi:hypothetical protein
MAEELEAVPMGLQAASGVLQGHADQLLAPSRQPTPETEAAGVAAVALTNAFERFGTVFGHRLSCASTQLSRAAGTYISMDEVNRQAVEMV